MQKLARSDKYHQRKPRRAWRLLFKLTLGAGLLGVCAAGILLLYLYQADLPLADSDRNSQLIDSKGNAIAVFSDGGKTAKAWISRRFHLG
ncbi:hypothetical protein HMSSN036_93910 [Paenibacillus macerans]|nr:hypothetical protein HMSSN036_93910 [Paenibacillus macerans]